MTGVLVDTNLLIYAYRTDPKDPRVGKAKATLAEVVLKGTGWVSVQNLAEFSSVCLTKVKPPVSPAAIREAIDGITLGIRVVGPSAQTVKTALSAVETHRLSFWDAMVWAVARENAIGEVLTEDFQDGQVVEGVRFRNPLR